MSVVTGEGWQAPGGRTGADDGKSYGLKGDDGDTDADDGVVTVNVVVTAAVAVAVVGCNKR